MQNKAHCLESYNVYFEVYAIIYYLDFQVYLNVWNQYWHIIRPMFHKVSEDAQKQSILL